MREIEAVTFDYWNTLIWEEPGTLRERRVAAWLGILDGAGIAIVRQELEEAHQRAFELASDSWVRGEQYQAVHAIEHMVATLGLDVPPDVRDALLRSFDEAGLGTELHETPNIRQALEALRDRGIRLGIVCDVGLTPSTVLRDHLERRGLMGYFGAWAFSDEVGVYKPDSRIFGHVLDRLAAAPGNSAHVGDLVRTDVAGALAAGMMAVRYTGIFDDDNAEPEADFVVSDHAELPKVLALGHA